MLATAKIFSAPPLKIEKAPKYEPKLFSDFVRGVKDEEITQIQINPGSNTVYFAEEDGTLGVSNYTPSSEFWKTMIDSKADINIDNSSPITIADGISMFFIILFFTAVFRMFSQLGQGPPNPFNMNKTELDVENQIVTRFSDVEGIDNAKDELEEIVDFLREPERFIGTGAKIPRGALLTGKPGTGKTLLARAIAGESSVPFIQCSGSSFVEMFVGVGAKRVRDVFEMARKNQPCIVFIDEIDAIGKKRSAGGFPANDEREQTINQLLTEMDGFDNTSQIVVIAATNRSDILDDALLRPGRFDRKIQVALPSVKGRRKILDVHAANKKLDDEVDLDALAKQTTGFSGADLANLMNECAIRGAREGSSITPTIVENVYQRIVVGAVGDVKFSMRKKELVAYHEAGHAIMGVLSPEFDLLRKVSIIARGAAGGITFFQPTEENADSAMYTKEYLMSQIKVALGGRAAEEIIYGPDRITTGASSDYARVYSIAREMVTTYGLGKRNFDVNNISPEAAHLLDLEIDAIVESAYLETKGTLETFRNQLEIVKNKLIEEEIVDGEWIYKLFDTESCNEFECVVRF